MNNRWQVAWFSLALLAVIGLYLVALGLRYEVAACNSASNCTALDRWTGRLDPALAGPDFREDVQRQLEEIKPPTRR